MILIVMVARVVKQYLSTSDMLSLNLDNIEMSHTEQHRNLIVVRHYGLLNSNDSSLVCCGTKNFTRQFPGREKNFRYATKSLGLVILRRDWSKAFERARQPECKV